MSIFSQLRKKQLTKTLLNPTEGTSLAVQWLRLHFHCRVSSIPGLGTKIPHADFGVAEKLKQKTNTSLASMCSSLITSQSQRLTKGSVFYPSSSFPYQHFNHMGLPMVLMVKNPLANAGKMRREFDSRVRKIP